MIWHSVGIWVESLFIFLSPFFPFLKYGFSCKIIIHRSKSVNLYLYEGKPSELLGRDCINDSLGVGSYSLVFCFVFLSGCAMMGLLIQWIPDWSWVSVLVQPSMHQSRRLTLPSSGCNWNIKTLHWTFREVYLWLSFTTHKMKRIPTIILSKPQVVWKVL